jgi:hypothetical protein
MADAVNEGTYFRERRLPDVPIFVLAFVFLLPVNLVSRAFDGAICETESPILWRLALETAETQ